MYRRRALVTGTTILVGLAGCSRFDAGPADETDTRPPTESEPSEQSGFSNQPDYNETVRIRNFAAESLTVEVEIIHIDTDETIHSGSPTVAGEAEMELFDFSELGGEYEGVETFEIRAETSEYSDSIAFETSVCHTGPRISVAEDDINVNYDMC